LAFWSELKDIVVVCSWLSGLAARLEFLIELNQLFSIEFQRAGSSPRLVFVPVVCNTVGTTQAATFD